MAVQIDNMMNGASVLDDDDRFADLPALPLVNDAGSKVALPDFTARASWESCCATLREGLSQMPPAQVSNQVSALGVPVLRLSRMRLCNGCVMKVACLPCGGVSHIPALMRHQTLCRRFWLRVR